MHRAIRLGLLLSLVPFAVACQPAAPTPSPTPSAPTAPSTVAPAPTPSTPSPSPAPTSATPSPTPTTVPANTHFYNNLTPYPAPAKRNEASPGAGFAVVFSENIARHGSRSLTTDTDATRVLATWDRASEAGALTDLGKGLGPAVRKLEKAMKAVGLGQLSARGVQEQRGLGTREGQRLSTYFSKVAQHGDKVSVTDTGLMRTESSAANFVAGLKSTRPALRVDGPRSQPSLHFGETDRTYQDFLKNNKQWQAAYASAVNEKALKAAAVQGLERLYSPEFVRTISNPATQAASLWDLYRVQPGMDENVDVDLAPYMDPTTAAALAFADDAEFFYSRGPGVTGTDGAHSVAQPLLDSFIAAGQARLEGGSTAAVYRFAHDLELAPFAALLELPRSRQLSSPTQPYSWSDSTFRTSQVVPLAANIEWTFWRNGAGRVLVQIRQNEVPVTLGYACRVAVRNGSFYGWSELKRCLPNG